MSGTDHGRPIVEPDPRGDGRTLVCAAVDVGSNSAHLLVAKVCGTAIEPLLDESALLGLGATVDVLHVVGSRARTDLVATLTGYADRAGALGAAGRVAFVGTEPLRRAADARRVAWAVEGATGVPLHVLDHEEEGLLTLLGATAARPEHGRFLVADIGGGSSELVLAGGGHTARTIGLRVGGARLSRAVGLDDPPTPAQLERLLDEARRAIGTGTGDTVPGRPASVSPGGAGPARMVAVGGTANNLAKLVLGSAADGVITLADLDAAARRLSSRPAAEIGAAHLIRPERVRMLAAGAAILRAILEHYGLGQAAVTDRGIREGLVLALARAGAGWRDQLESLARDR